MRNKLMTRIVVVTGMFMVTPDIAGPLSAEIRVDPRVSRLRLFLEEKDCPIQDLAPDFIEAADRHGLDWRLLPSISFIESTGGKYCRRNNIFGWANANKRFPSIRHGIHVVAHNLGQARQYRSKGTDGILKTYNPRPEYAIRVKEVMERIGPEPVTDPMDYEDESPILSSLR